MFFEDADSCWIHAQKQTDCVSTNRCNFGRKYKDYCVDKLWYVMTLTDGLVVKVPGTKDRIIEISGTLLAPHTRSLDKPLGNSDGEV